MCKYIFLIVCLLIQSVLTAYTQTSVDKLQKVFLMSKVDSLKIKLDTAEGVSKLEFLAQIGQWHVTDSPDSLRKYAKILLDEAKMLDKDEYQAVAYRFLGIGYSMKQIYDDSSALFYKLALRHTDDLSLKGDIYQSQAGLEQHRGNYDVAIGLLLKCANIFDSLNNSAKLANAYGGIGNVFLAQGQSSKALEYLHKCRRLAKKNNYTHTLLPIFANIAIAYNSSKQYDSCIHYALQCYNLSKELNQTFGIAKSAQILSEGYGQTKQYLYAQKYAEEARLIFTKMGASTQVVITKITEAHALYNLGHYDEAEYLLNQAEMEMDSTLPQLKVFLYKTIKDNYHVLGKNEQAFVYSNKYFEAYKNVNDKERNKQIAELETKYETEKKSKEILELTGKTEVQMLKIQQQYWIIIGAVLLFSVIVLLIVLFYRQRNLRKQNELLSVEHRFLRSQMNPHFIFNALGAIQKFVIKSDPMQGATFIAKFSALMRKVLEHSREEFITIEEEIETLKNYLDLQKLRFEDQFDYEIKVSDNMDTTTIKIPPMFAQPFIENALEHGIAKKQEGGKIVIAFEEAGNDVRLIIKDNGTGLDDNDNRADHKSLATKITQERLQRFSTKLGKTDLFIKNLKDDLGKITGVEVSLLLPTG